MTIEAGDLMNAWQDIDSPAGMGDDEPPTRDEVDPDAINDMNRADARAEAKRRVAKRLDAVLLGIGAEMGRKRIGS